MRRKLMLASLCVLVLVVALTGDTWACTSILVSKGASADGSVMTTHTCDGGYDFRMTLVPAKDHKPGEMRPVYKGGGDAPDIAAPLTKVGEIPEVAHTYAYINIAYPFMNENQVMIGETTWGGRSELYNKEGWFEIWELERIALERAKTAREAIQIMGSLAEEYGYGDYGEELSVCDTKEAWMFEIAGAGPFKKGAVWAAQRIPDGEVGVSANRSRIGVINFNDPENFMWSKNLPDLAIQMGWYDPKSGPFAYNKAYGPKQSFYNSRREWRVLSLIAPSLKLDPWADEFPFSVKPDKKLTVQDILAIQRDHYEGTEFDLTKGPAAGPWGCPNRYATPSQYGEWERAISMFRCSYSFCSQSRDWLPNPIGGVLWFGEDAPHSTCYIPFYCGITKVPYAFTIGRRDVLDRNAAWWAFDLVSNLADLKYSYMIKDIQEVYGAFEAEAFAMQPAIEKVALELYKTDPKLAASFLTNYTEGLAQRVVAAYWALYDKLLVKYNDGYVDRKTVGYPPEWLKSIGFGKIQKPVR